MIPLSITPNIELAPWTDMKPMAICRENNNWGVIVRIGRLPNGTTGGKSTVTVLIQLPDGKHVAAETTFALFDAAARTLRAREDFENPPEPGMKKPGQN